MRLPCLELEVSWLYWSEEKPNHGLKTVGENSSEDI